MKKTNYWDLSGTQTEQQVEIENDRSDGPQAIVTTLDAVMPERVTWLWPGRLPIGKTVMLDGDPSTGKSTLAIDWAARISSGTAWPDGQPCPVGDVLIMSAEDGLADTISPRLIAADADMHRVHALEYVRRLDEYGAARYDMPTIPRDIPIIKSSIERHNVKLFIVDVMNSYLDGRTDTNNDHGVRGALAPLATMADKAGCCVLLLRHLNKSGGTNATYRGGGSIGIIGSARVGLIVARDQDDADRHLLGVSKSNLSRIAPTLAYRLVEVPEVGCARVEWEDSPVNITASEMLTSLGSDEERQDMNDCQRWLVDYIRANGGEASANDTIKAGQTMQFTKDQIKHARARSKNPRIIPERRGFGGGFVWHLDNDADTLFALDSSFGAIGASQKRMAPMAPMEEKWHQ